MTTRKTIRTSVLLPESAYDQLQVMADANDVSTAWIIRQAIQKFLDDHHGQIELPLQVRKDRGGVAR